MCKFCLTVDDGNIEMRIKNACKGEVGGVDIVIDFVSSTRTVGCVTKVLNKASNFYIIK